MFSAGLDPAGPSFTLVSPDDRLDPSDAEHVDVIHTAAGSYGTLRTDNGHIDFFPNGGFLQRGCSFKLLGKSDMSIDLRLNLTFHWEKLDFLRISLLFSNFSAY